MEVEMKEKEPEYYKPLPKREIINDYVPGYFEREETLINAALDKFKRYREGRPYFDFGNPTYDYLTEKGIIHISAEVRQQIFDEAKKQVMMEKGFRPSIVSERVKIEQELGLEITAKNRAKQIALEYFFSELVTHERELSEMI